MKLKLSVTDTIARNDGHVETEMGSEVIMMNIGTGKYHSIDAQGRVIWDLIGSGTKVQDIVDILTAKYDVPTAQCEADTIAFLTELIEQKLAHRTATA